MLCESTSPHYIGCFQKDVLALAAEGILMGMEPGPYPLKNTLGSVPCGTQLLAPILLLVTEIDLPWPLEPTSSPMDRPRVGHGTSKRTRKPGLGFDTQVVLHRRGPNSAVTSTQVLGRPCFLLPCWTCPELQGPRGAATVNGRLRQGNPDAGRPIGHGHGHGSHVAKSCHYRIRRPATQGHSVGQGRQRPPLTDTTGQQW